MAEQSNKLIVILAGALLAVVVVASALFIMMPSSDNKPSDTSTPGIRETSTPVAGFKVDVLQRSAYQLLNRQLVAEGALPVQPPLEVGKANPFL